MAVLPVLLLGTIALSAPGAGAATVVTMPSPSGRDDSGAIKAAIDGAPDGATLVFPANARYLVNGGISLRDRSDIVIDGNGSSFVMTAVNRNQTWEVLGGRNITLQEIRVIGSNQDFAITGDYEFETQHAFIARATSGLTLRDVSASNTSGDGLCLCAPVNGVSNEKVRVSNFRFERTGRHAIAVVGARDVIIEDGYIGEGNVGGLQLEGNGPGSGAFELTFRNNTVGRMGRGFAHIGGRKGSRSENITIENNRLTGMDMYFRANSTEMGTRKKNIRIIDNVSDTATRSTLSNGHRVNTVMIVTDTDVLEVRGNVQPSRTSIDFLETERSTGVIESNNI